MEKPSFKSSPWIRGAPHRVFSRDIRRTRWRISLDTGGRPGFLRRDFHVQKSLNPLRCQPMTVSGLTITRAWRQPGHRQDRMTQKTLSAFRSDGRGLFRFRTATCCRRARISVWSAARSAKISMILCMPERVSGGDAKFQGFCDRWNKWEGQRPPPNKLIHYRNTFRSTPPREGRPAMLAILAMAAEFRSTPPREGRPCKCCSRRTRVPVSIHAPTRGATNVLRVKAHVKQFRSTPPREGRRPYSASMEAPE